MTPGQRVLLRLEANACWPGARVSRARGISTLGVEPLVIGGGASDFGAVAPAQSPEAAAAIAFRTLWNTYVMASLKAMDLAYQSLQNVSQNPPAGFTAQELQNLANTYAGERDAGLTAWNQFSGLTPGDITAQSGVMIRAFQAVIDRITSFWANEMSNALHPAGSEPAKPSAAAQAAVKAQIDASGALTKTQMQLSMEGVGQNPLPIPNPFGPLIDWITAHKTLLMVGGVVLAGGIVLAYVAPMLKLAAMPLKALKVASAAG